MPTMEDDNQGHWTDPDPDKCLECRRARACSTKFFYLDREYPPAPDHCECGHVSDVLQEGGLDEAKATGRVPHAKLCSDHSFQVYEAWNELREAVLRSME